VEACPKLNNTHNVAGNNQPPVYSGARAGWALETAVAAQQSSDCNINSNGNNEMTK